MNPHFQLAFIAVKIRTSMEKALFKDADRAVARHRFKELTSLTMPTPPPLKGMKMPDLGPFNGETAIEPYNRIMKIMLYVHFSTNKLN